MASEKFDPLSEEFYAPLVDAERAADVLFAASAALSIAVLVISPVDHPIASTVVAVAFPTSVVLLFALSVAIRLYFAPRAQQGRLRDFLAHVYGAAIPFTRSQNFYNNEATTPTLRIAAQALESTFFTKFIARKMCARLRLIVGAYVFLWIVVVFNRATDLASISVGAQLLFSEQILSRLLRLEWLRAKSEALYDRLLSVAQTKKATSAATLELFAWYEIVKATATISLSTNVFDRHATRLSQEWDELRQRLKI